MDFNQKDRNQDLPSTSITPQSNLLTITPMKNKKPRKKRKRRQIQGSRRHFDIYKLSE
ncbi:hypothetical protein LguiB_009277 [Lonicera macranthoides]